MGRVVQVLGVGVGWVVALGNKQAGQGILGSKGRFWVQLEEIS